jgi:vitamin B12 transporter
MKKPLALIPVLLCLVVTASRAQDRDSTQKLGTVVISASKVPQPAATLTQAVTVLSGEDLRARGVSRVSDALREVPGTSLVQSGSYGAVTSLFLRGGESRYTKVLIDGVPVNSSGGFFDFSHLTTDNIDRIEIVRGPASVLYGADAVSGIVQIFTRRGEGESRASIAVRGGTYRSVDGNADIGSDFGAGAYSLGAGHHSTKGILPFNNQYSNGTLSSRLTVLRTERGQANLSARYTAAEFHYPTDFTGAPVDTNSYRTQHRLTVGFDATRNFMANLQGRLLAGSNDVRDLTEDIAVPFGGTAPQHSASRSRGFRRNAEARLSMFLPTNATVTVGAGYEIEHEHSSNEAGAVGGQASETDSFDASRHNVAYYSEVLGSLADRISYTVSGRVDDNSDYDRFKTYRLGMSGEVIHALRLRASVSNAFNAPAFNQLRPTLFTVGSPDLQPERVRSVEAGVVMNIASGLVTASGNVFTQRFDNLIQFVSGGPPDFKGSYANLTGAQSNGYEGELAVVPSLPWRASASFTVVNPRVTRIPAGYQGSDRVGDALVRRPTHSGNVVVSYAATHGSLVSVAANYAGKRPDFDFTQFPSPRVTLPAYTKVDIAAEYPLTRVRLGNVRLSARLENAFDKRYEEVLNFPAPGRVVLLGLKANAAF